MSNSGCESSLERLRNQTNLEAENSFVNLTKKDLFNVIENTLRGNETELRALLFLEKSYFKESEWQPPAPASASEILEQLDEEVVEEDSVDDQQDTSLGILLFLLSIVLALLIGYWLKQRKVEWLHETGAALIFGCMFGFVFQWIPSGDLIPVLGLEGVISLHESILFNDDFFFLVLLPPIIFDAGFNTVPLVLKDRFWENMDAICMFAFLGTTMSTGIIGFGVYATGLMGLCKGMPLLHSLAFGALVSATDPVTTLAIFQEHGADLDLYALVFGESVLNDAIAIVLYQSLLSFQSVPADAGHIWQAFLAFWFNLCGSVLVGVLVALFTSVLLKHTSLSRKEYEMNEAGILVVMPYVSYIMAIALNLSGIITILFCGIAMARYTVCHISRPAYTIASNFYKITASVFEFFIFIYMGVTVFGYKLPWSGYISLAVVSLLWSLLGRYVNVRACTVIINSWRTPKNQITPHFMQALWLSGLRGAVAFALALSAQSDLEGDESVGVLTSTIGIVFFTVLIGGGGTPRLVVWLKQQSADLADSGTTTEEGPSLTRSSSPSKDTREDQYPGKGRFVNSVLYLENRFRDYITSIGPNAHARLPTSTSSMELELEQMS